MVDDLRLNTNNSHTTSQEETKEHLPPFHKAMASKPCQQLPTVPKAMVINNSRTHTKHHNKIIVNKTTNQPTNNNSRHTSNSNLSRTLTNKVDTIRLAQLQSQSWNVRNCDEKSRFHLSWFDGNLLKASEEEKSYLNLSNKFIQWSENISDKNWWEFKLKLRASRK